jgi:hypothetical protein
MCHIMLPAGVFILKKFPPELLSRIAFTITPHSEPQVFF